MNKSFNPTGELVSKFRRYYFYRCDLVVEEVDGRSQWMKVALNASFIGATYCWKKLMEEAGG